MKSYVNLVTVSHQDLSESWRSRFTSFTRGRQAEFLRYEIKFSARSLCFFSSLFSSHVINTTCTHSLRFGLVPILIGSRPDVSAIFTVWPHSEEKWSTQALTLKQLVSSLSSLEKEDLHLHGGSSSTYLGCISHDENTTSTCQIRSL